MTTVPDTIGILKYEKEQLQSQVLAQQAHIYELEQEVRQLRDIKVVWRVDKAEMERLRCKLAAVKAHTRGLTDILEGRTTAKVASR